MASKYLQDRGFNLADAACDVSVRFRPFDDVSANLVVRPGGDWSGSASVEGTLSLEGTLDVKHRERAVVQEQVVALHSRDSVQTLLDQLARAMVEPVVTRFSPPSASQGN